MGRNNWMICYLMMVLLIFSNAYTVSGVCTEETTQEEALVIQQDIMNEMLNNMRAELLKARIDPEKAEQIVGYTLNTQFSNTYSTALDDMIKSEMSDVRLKRRRVQNALKTHGLNPSSGEYKRVSNFLYTTDPALVNDIDFTLSSMESRDYQSLEETSGAEISYTHQSLYDVGGDYLSSIAEEGKLFVDSGDVKNKGFEAAMYKSVVEKVKSDIISEGITDPVEFAKELNSRLYQATSRKLGQFIAYSNAQLDTETGQLDFAAAGHKVYIVRKSGLEIHGDSSMAAGYLPPAIFDSNLDSGSTILEEGESFVLMSDGITEAMNSDNKEFEREGLSDERVDVTIKDSDGNDQIIKGFMITDAEGNQMATSSALEYLLWKNRGKSSAEIHNALIDAVEDFRGDAARNDDLSVAVVEFRKEATENPFEGANELDETQEPFVLTEEDKDKPVVDLHKSFVVDGDYAARLQPANIPPPAEVPFVTDVNFNNLPLTLDEIILSEDILLGKGGFGATYSVENLFTPEQSLAIDAARQEFRSVNRDITLDEIIKENLEQARSAEGINELEEVTGKSLSEYDGMKYAVKLTKPRSDQSVYDTIEKEESMIDHIGDNLMQVYATGSTEQGYGVVVMEEIQGDDMYNMIHERGSVSSELQPVVDMMGTPEGREKVALWMVHDISNALKELGPDMVHADLKPGNIMVEWDQSLERPVFKLIDFGEVRGINADLEGIIRGTPLYMSPEQADGAFTDKRSDQYSLGLIAYEVINRQNMFLEDLGKGAGIMNTLDHAYSIDQDVLDSKVDDLKASKETKNILKKMLTREDQRYFEGESADEIKDIFGERYQSEEELMEDAKFALEGSFLQKMWRRVFGTPKRSSVSDISGDESNLVNNLEEENIARADTEDMISAEPSPIVLQTRLEHKVNDILWQMGKQEVDDNFRRIKATELAEIVGIELEESQKDAVIEAHELYPDTPIDELTKIQKANKMKVLLKAGIPRQVAKAMGDAKLVGVESVEIPVLSEESALQRSIGLENLIEESLSDYAVKRLDASNPVSAEYASNKITPGNIDEIFSYEYERGVRGAKAVTYKDEKGVIHTRFWSFGLGSPQVHHRDAISSLLNEEGKSLEEIAIEADNVEMLDRASDKVDTSIEMSEVRQQNTIPDDVLYRSQGFQFTLGEDGKIRYFDVDSSITATQASRNAEINAKEFSDAIMEVHNSIDPELRGYGNIIRVKGLGRLRFDEELNLGDDLRVVEI